ncbi:MAG TPA: DMT family transporter [Clostridia bacterium]|nr:DMT family transporter [Clostridia bacterium]
MSNIFLLLAAMIWGFSFVAQRLGSQYLGAFAFNGIRFGLGCLVLLPPVLISLFRNRLEENFRAKNFLSIKAGIIVGVALYAASALQQLGLAETTAGKAGFITDMYIVIVPLLGVFLGHKIPSLTWVSVALSVVGLYLISVTGQFGISRGDLLVLGGAFLWAAQIILISHFANNVDTLIFSLFQFLTCSVLSLITTLFTENISWGGVLGAGIPILYGGVLSVGVAFTLQMFGQKHARPSHAALLMSMEAVFACLGGMLILKETLEPKGYLGCALIVFAMILSQSSAFKKEPVQA